MTHETIKRFLYADGGDIMYELYTPLKFTVCQYSGGFVAEYKDLGLIGAGENSYEAVDDLKKEFSHLYEKLINIDDDLLSANMRSIKQRFIKLVKKRSLKWM